MATSEESIFAGAIEKKTPEEREAFLDQACAGNLELRRSVESLLAAYEAGQFLESPAAGFLVAEASADAAEAETTVIGPYKLLQEIGEGGMGVVYMAEQTEPVERLVALKIIKYGMDTRQVIARFEAERHTLALMDHPNIARVLDAGTTERGRPYFVMELVKGIPITQYCDEHHLTPQQRLELFIPVCHAVQHAHQKGIIHRDIKPGNVLVAEYDERPVPKIIDFGVAKAIDQRLTERSVYTQLGLVVGTIDYMSPEQAKLNQLDVDTRSDVYSLGVLLYELLTGETPFDRERLRSAAFDELLRIIREEEPPKPSMRLSSSELLPSIAANRHTEPKKLSTLVRGELDWIVMKALEKDRARRYETANSLATDVTHYLADEPVAACPPSAAYRFRKFARRNKRLLVTTAIIGVTLVVTTLISTLLAIWATNAEARAAERLVAEQQAVLERSRHLWRSYVNEAAALRRTRRVGHRFESLDRLRKAARMLAELRLPEANTLELRNEWIACSALPVDVQFEKDIRMGEDVVVMDAGLRYCLCRDDQRSVHLYRLADGKQVNWLEAYNDFEFDLWGNRFSPNSRFLAAHSRSNIYRIWDLDEHRSVGDIPMQSGCYAVDFTPDSQAVAYAQEDRRIHFMDLASGTEFNALPEGPMVPRRLRFSPDGRQLAVVFDGSCKIHVRDAQTGETRPLPHPALVRLAGWSFDGRLLSVSCEDFNIYVWDTDTWRQRAILQGHQWGGIDAIFWPRSYRLYSSSWDGTQRFWDGSTGLELLRMSNVGWVVGISPDEREMVCHGPRGLRLWKVNTSQTCRLLSISAPGKVQRYSVDFHPGGRLLACAGDTGVHLLDLADERETAVLPITDCRGAVFHPADGRLITSAGAGLQQWPLETDVTSEDIRVGPGELLATTITNSTHRVCVSPDRQFLAAQSSAAVIWCDLQTRQTKVSPFIPDPTCFVSLSPDGRWVGSGEQTGEGFVIWDTQSDRDATTNLWAKSVQFWSVFDATGRWLYVSTREECRIYEVATWGIVHQIVPDQREAIGETNFGPAAFSPDSRILAMRSAHGNICLLDTATWTEWATLEPFEPRTVVAIAFSPDESLLAAATLNDGVQLWDLRQIRRELREVDLDWGEFAARERR